MRLIKCSATDNNDADAVHTAAVIDALSVAIRSKLKEHPMCEERKAAGKHPANVVLLRGCGKRIDAPLFCHVHEGLKACMIAPTKIIAGIGKTLGIDVLETVGATGDYFTNVSAKAHKAAEALALQNNCAQGNGGYDFCFLHVKGIDDAGHDKNCALKTVLIERADRMVSQLIRLLWEEQKETGTRFVMCITGDHTTPVHFGDHSHEPVPFVVARLNNIVHFLGEEYIQGISLDPILPPADPTFRNQGQSSCLSDRLVSQDHHDDGDPIYKDTKRLEYKGKAHNDSIGIDAVQSFSEKAVTQGSLGRFPGQEVMPLLLRMKSEYASAGE